MNGKSVMDMIDFGSLFGNIMSQMWWFLPLLLLLVLCRSAWFKGMIGEAMVNLAAHLFLDKNVYYRIKNVILPAEDGTTRMDHIIVSRYGIFVVETKNMKGLIFGDKHQKTWTQQIYKSKYKLQNPLHQVYKHSKILQARLGLESDKLFSIVAFIGDSIFATPMPDNVSSGGGYIRYIKSKTKLLLSETEVQQIIRQITEERLEPPIRAYIQHANHVQGCVEPKQAVEKELAKICPKCGSNMYLRTVMQGPEASYQFWGCTSFPECREIVDVG